MNNKNTPPYVEMSKILERIVKIQIKTKDREGFVGFILKEMFGLNNKINGKIIFIGANPTEIKCL